MEQITSRLQDELTGALIGLANATVGNEDLIEEQTMELVLRGLVLRLDENGANEDALQALLRSVRAEKARIVPNCAACINPCGRNADYDMELLWTDHEEIRAGKLQILSGIRRMAREVCRAENISGMQKKEFEAFILNALRAVGDDWMAEALRPMIEATEQMSRKVMGVMTWSEE
jgi:hydroxylamine reductase